MGTLQSVSNEPAPIGAPPPERPGINETDLEADAVETAAPISTAPTPKAPVSVVTIVSAAAILALFAWLFGIMLDRGVPSANWDRYLALYNSVQSIVAAAVGALLGAQVSASQAVVARTEGTAAKQRADRLESNIRGFQTDVARTARSAESGDLAMRERLLTRAMTLLH